MMRQQENIISIQVLSQQQADQMIAQAVKPTMLSSRCTATTPLQLVHQVCNRLMRVLANMVRKTMKGSQALYEQSYITYMPYRFGLHCPKTITCKHDNGYSSMTPSNARAGGYPEKLKLSPGGS